jgi:hypothetical protein
MKTAAAVLLLLSTAAAPAAIPCQNAAGREPGVHWWWRDIDGKRCWFKLDGPVPPKSAFKWEKEDAREGVVEPAPTSAEQRIPSIRILKTLIAWEGISDVEANWIDGDAPVDLMRGDSLSGPAGVGGTWIVPSYKDSVDETTSFAARFAPVIESGKARTN